MTDFAAVLHKLWPNGDARIPGLRAAIAASAPDVFARHGITTPLLVAHVMAQISHECGAGRDVVENLNYTVARMRRVWPKRFPTSESAQPFAGNPRALANKVYNGRTGNRVGSDDGWTFRGRGAAQTTGRDGYARLAQAIGLDLVAQPDLVLSPAHFLACGVTDFIACGCLPFALRDDIVGVTRRLNGGAVGLAERRVWLANWKAALGDAPIVIASPPLAPQMSPPPHPSALATCLAALRALFRR